MRLISLLSLLVLLFANFSLAEDWPQWMGPNRDGVYEESGLVERIPQDGLPVVWRVPVAKGYSGPAVADGRVFLTDYVMASGKITNNPGGRDELSGSERVLCFDSQTGEQLWKTQYDRAYKLSYPSGPRATPTVDGDCVYVLGAEGDLLCLSVNNGDIVWRKQLASEFQTQAPIWGYAAHPLIYGDLLITLAGGPNSAAIAVNKKTGNVVWQALTTNEIGYCPPTIAKLGGVDQLIIWHSEALNGLEPETGKVIWSYPLRPRYGMSIAAPQILGNRLFASGIGETSALIEFDADGMPGETSWKGKPKIGVYSGNATALFTEQAIYGSDCGSGAFTAVDPANGDRFWETYQLTTGGDRRASHGTAFVVRNQDRFWLMAETGDLILAKMSPAGFQELGRMHLLEPTNECFGRAVVWSHPAFADKHVFARNDKELVCVSLAK